MDLKHHLDQEGIIIRLCSSVPSILYDNVLVNLAVYLFSYIPSHLVLEST